MATSRRCHEDVARCMRIQREFCDRMLLRLSVKQGCFGFHALYEAPSIISGRLLKYPNCKKRFPYRNRNVISEKDRSCRAMGGVAYSYLRFSTPEQSRGDSRRRQTAMAESYATRHGLQLDTALNFRDLGMSAFRSKNARQGGLRDFLLAVEYSLVPPESILLIESLDRLSRAEVLEAQALFLQIINAGITIVTLLDERSYSKVSINLNPIDLLISLIIMMRANEESATKSKRLRAAVAANRDDPASRYHGAQCPAWLKPNANRTGYEIIPERGGSHPSNLFRGNGWAWIAVYNARSKRRRNPDVWARQSARQAVAARPYPPHLVHADRYW